MEREECIDLKKSAEKQDPQRVPGGTQEPELCTIPGAPGIIDEHWKCHFSVTWCETGILCQFCFCNLDSQTQLWKTLQRSLGVR